MELGAFSPRFVTGLGVFVAGLIALGLALPIIFVFIQRRATNRNDDYALRLLQNGAVPLALQMGNRAIDFAFGIVLFYVLWRDQAAIQSYNFAAFIATLLLATIAEWGLNIYLTREVARDHSAITRTFGTTLWIRLAFGLLVLPASLLVIATFNGLQSVGLIANGIDAQGQFVLLLLAATVPPSAWSGAVTALFLATERPIVPAVVALWTNVLSTLLRIGVLLLGFGVIGMARSALGATIVNALIFAVLLRRQFGWPGLSFDRRMAAQMVVASFPPMLNALLLAVFFRFDLAIISANLSAEHYNAYDAAYKYIGLTQILPPIVINAVFPLFARQAAQNRAALSRAYAYTVRLLVLIALPLAVIVTIAAPVLIALYDNTDEQVLVALGTPALQLLIWYLPFSYINGVTQYVLIALDRPSTITRSFGLAALFNLAFNLVFVPRYGIRAAAVATVLSELVLYLPLWRTMRRELGPQPIWAMLWRPALAALGMATGMALLTGLHLIVAIGAGLVVFGGLLLALGEVQDDDRHLVRRILRRV